MSWAGAGRTSSEAGSLPSGVASTPRFLSRIHVHTRCPFCVCINRLTLGVARMDVHLPRPKHSVVVSWPRFSSFLPKTVHSRKDSGLRTVSRGSRLDRVKIEMTAVFASVRLHQRRSRRERRRNRASTYGVCERFQSAPRVHGVLQEEGRGKGEEEMWTKKKRRVDRG